MKNAVKNVVIKVRIVIRKWLVYLVLFGLSMKFKIVIVMFENIEILNFKDFIKFKFVIILK